MLSTLLPVLPDIIDYSREYEFSFDVIDDAIIYYGFFVMFWFLLIWLLPIIKYRNIKSKQNAEINMYLLMKMYIFCRMRRALLAVRQ